MVAEDEDEFNYDEKCEKGPPRWGQIRTEWSMCGHGTVQSPIDLLNKGVEVVSYLGRLKKDEGEFNYDEKCEKGPSRWGEIRTEWSMCGHGTVQSPIDLLNKRVEVVSYLGRLKKDEGEFNYDEKCEKGPSRWGEIRTEWSMCGHGIVQSPIDLLNKRVEVVSYLGRLKSSYKSAYANRERKIGSTPSYLII
ncbi:alpha carbonic anhydrase 7 [Quercus suber]|uniref:Alpha carbonic anhydrase 7 n=1 Tax=Quercus suber TaxID=58331 RepID=A0AAW0KT39_QUESU